MAAQTPALAPMDPDEIHALIKRVGAIAAGYSNLARDEAIRFIMATDSIGEADATFIYGLEAGTITGDLNEVK